MGEALELTAIAAATALATGLGAVPVALLSAGADMQPLLGGIAAGVMGVAAVVGLAIPSFEEGSAGVAVACLLAGAAALLLIRRRLVGAGAERPLAARRSLLVFGVLFAHSLPEGLAIGSAYAAKSSELGAFVIAAIAIQNIPEGTAVAIPLRDAGSSAATQIGAAVLTSVPQIPGALLAWAAVEQVESLLSVSFALAGGAMLALVFADTLPDAWSRGRHGQVLTGLIAGGGTMLATSALLGL